MVWLLISMGDCDRSIDPASFSPAALSSEEMTCSRHPSLANCAEVPPFYMVTFCNIMDLLWHIYRIK
jgi:hypothetical protein